MIRAEAKAVLSQWREVAIGGLVAATGIWVFSFGGLFFQALGVLVVLLGAALAVIGLYHMRFAMRDDVSGIVEVLEGQITYLSPTGGGFVALSELSRIRHVIDDQDRPFWLLSQRDASDLAVPVYAAGADALFDVFVSLPGAEAKEFLTALDRKRADGPITVWRPPFHVALT